MSSRNNDSTPYNAEKCKKLGMECRAIANGSIRILKSKNYKLKNLLSMCKLLCLANDNLCTGSFLYSLLIYSTVTSDRKRVQSAHLYWSMY